MNQDIEEIKNLVTRLYKDEKGQPLVLTNGQAEIFNTIARKTHPRNHLECMTRFGKSFTVGLAVLTRASTYPEKWAIVAGTKDKARIIMNYINAHIFDNEYTAGKFRMEKGDSAENIKRHRNKNHLTFDLGEGLIGEIYICSAKEALGFGAPNIIEDESALIPDNEHALVMRMLGDSPTDNFLCKIGNPFVRNHFLKSRLDPAYHQILIDCYRAKEEGRITQEQIDEAKKYSFFEVLYECKFPAAETVDEQGWSYLVTEEDIKGALERKVERYGIKRIGLDVARGGRNFNVWVLRGANYAKVLARTRDNDLMSVVGKTIELSREHSVMDREIFVDDVGVGGGVVDRLREQGFKVNAVKEGERAKEGEEFANCKAELYAGKQGLANWLKRTGCLDPHEGWEELTRIRFKKDSSGRTKIESKEDMRKRGDESPDVADALMLTFYDPVISTFRPVDPKTILDAGNKNRYL